MRGVEADRRRGPRNEGVRSGRGNFGSRGPRDAGARAECAGRTGGQTGPGGGEGALADSSSCAGAGPAVDDARNVRDGNQGRGPDRAVPERREDRIVRRRGRGQDRADHGADPQRRDEARRRVGVRGSGRAHARRQRPVAGNDRGRRYCAGKFGEIARGADLRPDDGAARRASARRIDGADRGRIFPRRGRARCAALHRQYFPIRAGRLGSFGAAGPHAIGGGLPAEPQYGNRRTAGAHYFDEERIDHVGAGDLRAGG